MAVVQTSYSFDMHTASTWYGSIEAATSTMIQIAAGSLVGTYYGNFSYDLQGNVYGTLTDYVTTYAGYTMMSVSGLNVDAHTAEYLIQTNQLQSLFQIAFAGSDQFIVNGGSGNHVIDGYTGYNSVSEPLSGVNYAIALVNSAFTVAESSFRQDTLYNVQRVAFPDGIARLDLTGNAEEAARLYQAALGRTPDASGLDYWTAQLDSHTLDLDGVSLGFINSAEFSSKYGSLDNTGFVTQLYQNVLHRAPDPAGEQYWVDQLSGGTSRASVLVGFSDSVENRDSTSSTIGDPHRAEAYRLYQSAFNRIPDAGGLDYWTIQLDHGTTPLQAAQGFVNSGEFSQAFSGLNNKGFVDQLYQNVLHRAADPTGEQYWMGQLNQGGTKAQVLLGLSDSLENRLNTSRATHDGWVYLASS